MFGSKVVGQCVQQCAQCRKSKCLFVNSVFVCKFCGMRFSVFSNARKHVKEKHGGKPLDLIDKV